ncbi:hypothetical protein [Eisenbergiella sp.]
MSETKRYYLGMGTEFIKAQCEEYKTIEGVLKAAAKNESFVVWDEDGNIIGSLTDSIPEVASDEQVVHVDGVEGGKDEENDGEWEKVTPAQEKDVNEAHSASEENAEEIPRTGITNEQVERFAITVSCEGSLRLRRSPSFTDDNECGRATKGQKYIGKRLFMVDGLPMAETIDGLFLSAAAEHVKIDKADA